MERQTRTPEEIKKGLESCSDALETNVCPGCPYYKVSDCADMVLIDALSLIQQLEAENSRKDDTIRSLTELLNVAHEETASVKREMGAALADLDNLNQCYVCAHVDCLDEEPCFSCMHRDPIDNFVSNFAWRGVCPENTEVQDNA